MLSEPLHRPTGQRMNRFSAPEEPRSAGDALTSLKRSLAVNLNEREKFRNKEQQAREELQKAEDALCQAQADLHEQRKEAAALRSQLEDQGIQQKCLQEKCQSHNTVGAYLQGAVAKLRAEVNNGDKLHLEMTAWMNEESKAREDLLAKARDLAHCLQHTETSLRTAEQNVKELQKTREILECKLAETQQAQVTDSATHAAEVEKVEQKVHEALTAKEELYRDLVSLQKVQGEVREALAREEATSEVLRNDLSSSRVEYSKTQSKLQQLENEHRKLIVAHEQMCARVKELEAFCSTLQADQSALKSAKLEQEAELIRSKEDSQKDFQAVSDDLERSTEACTALQSDLQEARDKNMKLVQEMDAAAAGYEVEASKSRTYEAELRVDLSRLQEEIKALSKDSADLTQDCTRAAQEKLASDEKLRDALNQVAALESELNTAQESFNELDVSSLMQDMAKSVCDADNQANIENLTSLLEHGAKELERTEARMQALSTDCEQHIVKRTEMESRITALLEQISQERDSNKAALEEQMRCMKADKAKALDDVEKQAAEHVKEIQQRAMQLQGKVVAKDIEVNTLRSELSELQKRVEESKSEIAAARQEHCASIERLEASHAAALSSKDDSTLKVKNLLDETEAEKAEQMAKLNRVQQALAAAKNELNEKEEHYTDEISLKQSDLDERNSEIQNLQSIMAELNETVDLERCEKKSVEAELEKRDILLRKFQGNQGKGSEMMVPLATPLIKTQHLSVPHSANKNFSMPPGSGSKKRKRHGPGGFDTSTQMDGKRNKKKNGSSTPNKPQAPKPPTAPLKKASSSVQMQRRGRLARMSNSAADSDRSAHVAGHGNRSQAGTLTSTEIFGGLLLGNL